MAGFVPGRAARSEPGLDLAEQKSWQNYLATVLRMTTVLNRQLTDLHQLTLADVQLLEILGDAASGSVRMGDLAGALALLPSRLTRQVRRLEVRGLVLRAVNPQDRRCVVVTITDMGRNLLGQAMVTYANAVRVYFLAPLSRPQVGVMAVSCRQIGDALKRRGRPGPARP
ncbi:MarR family transcriptional regulator [Mycobacterium sp. SVM_VP21]|nr:MarR family transcriptional regulator [Mycobacterium sp. SVM_VP21]